MDADVYSLKSEVRRLEYQVESLNKFRDDFYKEKREKMEQFSHRLDIALVVVMGLAWGALIVTMMLNFKHR